MIHIDSSRIIHLAVHAGRAVIDIYNHADDIGLSFKDDNSPLTKADTRSHRILCEGLDSRYPVLSEESLQVPYSERKEWNIFWLIDPLDGTKEFIKRNGEFTINIALIVEGRPYAGFVYAPVLDICWWGIEGIGAYRISGTEKLVRYSDLQRNGISKKKGNSQKTVKNIRNTDQMPAGVKQEHLPLARDNEPDRNGETADAVRVVASRSHLNEATQAGIEKLKERWGEITLAFSGSSLKLCRVAEGSADIYPRFGPTMEWDTAAADAVCRAAGCVVLDARTAEPLRCNKEDLHNPWFVVSRSRALAETIIPVSPAKEKSL